MHEPDALSVQKKSCPRMCNLARPCAYQTSGPVCRKEIKVLDSCFLEALIRPLYIAKPPHLDSMTLTFMPLAAPFLSPSPGLPTPHPWQIPSFQGLVQILLPLKSVLVLSLPTRNNNASPFSSHFVNTAVGPGLVSAGITCASQRKHTVDQWTGVRLSSQPFP